MLEIGEELTEVIANSIIDSGENENGKWVKFANGYIYQYLQNTIGQVPADVNTSHTLTLPQPMSEFVHANANMIKGTHAHRCTMHVFGGTTSVQIWRKQLEVAGGANTDLEFTVEVIGKWK